MRCSLSLLWTNELGKAEVLLELPEQNFVNELTKNYSSVIDRPKLWLRIKNVFRPITSEPIFRAVINETLNKFKSHSAKAHFEQIPIKRYALPKIPVESKIL